MDSTLRGFRPTVQKFLGLGPPDIATGLQFFFKNMFYGVFGFADHEPDITFEKFLDHLGFKF